MGAVDVLLSCEWPRGVDVGVADAEVEKLAECGVRTNAAGTWQNRGVREDDATEVPLRGHEERVLGASTL